jgi:hypothetical protein
MKPSKQEHPRVVARDTRPVKPALPAYTGPAKGHARPAFEAGERVKAPFERSAAKPAGALGEQQPRGESGRPGEQYLRLRIQVRGDRLTVIDSHLVDGPLSQPTTFHAPVAYDVTYGDRLLHAAAVPDIGVQRSFPTEQRGHHVTPREVSEFSARIPAGEVTRETIAGIRVRLHRVDEPTAVPRLAATPLATQFAGRMTPTAELVGLPDSALPEAVEARGGRTGQGS